VAPRLSPPMNGAYFNGLDQPAKPDNKPPLKSGLDIALDEIPGSVTTDYLLTSLNVTDTSPDINYGWNLPAVLASGGKVTQWTVDHLVKVVSAGVSQGKCKRVWFVVGGASNGPQTDTFTNIQAIFAKGGKAKDDLLANFGALYRALSIGGVTSVGFDMDYEEDGDLAAAVSDLTNHLSKYFAGRPCPFTFCPSFASEQNNWIEALRLVYKASGKCVVGYNLQCYAGGSGNNPKDWADYIAANATGTGVAPAEAPAFVWPIVSCDPDARPVTPSAQVAEKLKGWESQGASLWATRPTSGPPPDLKAYSTAIAQGIA
jgi:hypothetical protein